MAAVIGALRAELSARIAEFVSDMGKAADATAKFQKRSTASFSRMEKATASLNAGFKRMLASYLTIETVKGLVRVVQEVGDLTDAAQKAGVSIKDLQAITAAGIGTNTSQSDIVASLEMFNKKIGESVLKGGGLTKFFEANGVAIQKQNGQLVSTVDLFVSLGDLIRNAANEQERTVIATQALGKSGAEMIPFFMQGSAEIRKMMGAAEESGAVIDTNLVQAADEFGDKWGIVVFNWYQSFKGYIASLAVDLDYLFTSMGDRTITALERRANVLREQVANAKLVGPENEFFFGLDPVKAGKELLDVEKQIADLRQKERDAVKRDFGSFPSTNVTKVTKDLFDKGAPSGGGGRKPRSPGAAHEPTLNEYQQMTKAIGERIGALNVEASSVGKSAFEAEKAKVAYDLLEAAKKSGMTITPQLTAEIDKLAAAEALAATKADDLAKAYNDALDAMIRKADAVVDSFEGLFDKIWTEGKLTFKDLGAAAKDLAKELFITPIFDSLRKANSTGGGIAGIFSGLFSGGFASGGFIPPGHWGMAGEDGPEPVFGGRTGATVQPAGAGGQTINQYFEIKTPDANSFRLSQRQIMRRGKQAFA